ncbi:MAG: hypothetical protein A2145_01515 [candidate division Zixibacteria bacterium RBG_16_40_9]|nr:MAG: hypothetical protein A2145_01515 [candidate division Zixibacteria bacterium RBG_16_40_9]
MLNPELKNLVIRITVAIIGIPLLLLIALQGKLSFLGFVILLIILGLSEFSKLARAQNLSLPTLLLMLCGILIGLGVYFKGELALILLLLSSFLMLAYWEIKRENLAQENLPAALKSLSFSFLGLFYVAGLFSFLILIRELPQLANFDYRMGGKWMVFLYFSIWTCDTFAYFVGRAMGKHKLAPVISPRKTVEGAMAGVFGAILAAWVSQASFLNSFSFSELLPIALIVGIIGQIGDLVESLLKRAAGVKDSSGIIPGHGGVLDRFDSLIFVAPWVYYYLKLLVYSH